jgi:hypothetical protein
MHSAAGQGHDINRQSGESAPAQVARRARRQRTRQAHRDPKQRLKTPRHGGAGGHGRPGSDPGALLRPRITGTWRGAQPTGDSCVGTASCLRLQASLRVRQTLGYGSQRVSRTKFKPGQLCQRPATTRRTLERCRILQEGFIPPTWLSIGIEVFSCRRHKERLTS